MGEDDFWSRWLRRRNVCPYIRRWMVEDVRDIFREMEDFMGRKLTELSEKAPEALIRETVLPTGAKVKQWGPFVYGYSITVGPDGKPQIRKFGNIKPKTRMGRPSLDLKEMREPLVDVVTTNGEIQVLVELPGVAKEDIKLKATEESMIISVDTPKKKYYKKIELPFKADPKTAKSKNINGVLEVTIKKQKKKEEPEGETIEID